MWEYVLLCYDHDNFLVQKINSVVTELKQEEEEEEEEGEEEKEGEEEEELRSGRWLLSFMLLSRPLTQLRELRERDWSPGHLPDPRWCLLSSPPVPSVSA